MATALTADDLFEGHADKPHTCSCHKKPEAAASPVNQLKTRINGRPFSREAREPVEAIAEPLMASDASADVCMPWLRIVRDPDKFRACSRVSKEIGRVESSKQLYEIIRGQMEQEDQEVYYVIALDTQLFLRGIAEICRGARDRVHTPIQDTVRYAIAFSQLYGAQAVAIAHNHPSGQSKPSEADKDVTTAVAKACEANELLFIDHIIVGIGSTGKDYFSFRDNGFIKD